MEVMSKVVNLSRLEDIYNLLKDINDDTTIFLDIDDTIIAPVSSMFRVEPYKHVIDDLKNNSHMYENYEEIVSNWRLKRKVQLTDKKWPEVLNNIKKTKQVFALTKMHTGKFGNIKSVEEWRYKELLDMGIIFSQSDKLKTYVNPLFGKLNCPVFHNGIFLTGYAKKSEVLSMYRDVIGFKKIVMVDDSAQQIEDIKSYCKSNDIGFLGVLFSWANSKDVTPNHQLWDFQRNYLIEKAEWLEEKEAIIAMKS